MADEVRWLNDDEAAAWLPLLSLVLWLPAALDVQLERDAGISNYEYGVLSRLSMRERRQARLSDLAREANSTLPRLSKVIRRLSQQGWVAKHPDPTDGRSSLAVLTDAGWEKVVACAPAHVHRVRELVFDHLSPHEVRQLRAIATKVAAAVGPDGASADRFS